MKVLITGGNGQLGRALQEEFPDNIATDVEELDITDTSSVEEFDWDGIEAVLNAAAFTNVDGAELAENKELVNAVNVTGVENLAKQAKKLGIPLVHISTEYVFDGQKSGPYDEDDPVNPLSVYGKSKADGETAARLAPKHYVIRTSWLIGEGKNFVKTMLSLAEKRINPSVVNDQIGRLTFTPVLSSAISHLLSSSSPYGTYHVTNSGEPASWADVTRDIFKFAGVNNTVTDITTEEYFKGKDDVATRPHNSVMSLEKAHAAGIETPDWRDSLKEYIAKEIS